jgi:hypothetical protein
MGKLTSLLEEYSVLTFTTVFKICLLVLFTLRGSFNQDTVAPTARTAQLCGGCTAYLARFVRKCD